MLGLTLRRTERLRARYRRDGGGRDGGPPSPSLQVGPAGLISGNRDKPSNGLLPDEQRGRFTSHPGHPGCRPAGNLGYAIGAPAWSGFFGPQGMPSADVDKLAAAFGDAFKTEQWQKLCRERGMTPAYMGRSEFEAFAKQQAQFFGAEIPELLRMQR